MAAKKISQGFLFVASFLIALSSEGQINLDTPKKYDTVFYATGEIKILRQIDNGVVDGEFIEYYKNGKIKFRAKYKNGVLNGLADAWYEESDNIAFKAKYSLGREVEVTYFSPSGKKISRRKFYALIGVGHKQK